MLLHYALFEFKMTTKHLTPTHLFQRSLPLFQRFLITRFMKLRKLSILNIYLFFPFLHIALLELRRRLVSIRRISLLCPFFSNFHQHLPELNTKKPPTFLSFSPFLLKISSLGTRLLNSRKLINTIAISHLLHFSSQSFFITYFFNSRRLLRIFNIYLHLSFSSRSFFQASSKFISVPPFLFNTSSLRSF